MKDMSLEELIDEAIIEPLLADHKAELLRRFEELENSNKELRHRLDNSWKREDKINNDVLNLSLENNNLRCCGNCKKHHEDRNAVRMDRCNSRRWGYYCDHYQTDGLSRAEREGK